MNDYYVIVVYHARGYITNSDVKTDNYILLAVLEVSHIRRPEYV